MKDARSDISAPRNQDDNSAILSNDAHLKNWSIDDKKLIQPMSAK